MTIKPQRQYLLNIPIDLITINQAVSKIETCITQASTKLIFTPYASFWYWAGRDPVFARALKSADLSLPDGIGPLAALKFLDLPTINAPIVREAQIISQGLKTGWSIFTGKLETRASTRIRGINLVKTLVLIAEKKGWRVYFLGGWPQTGPFLEKFLTKYYPKLNFRLDSGPTDIHSPQAQSAFKRSLKQINKYKPHLLLVAFGPPFQEKWVSANKKKLKAGVVMCVGSVFEVLSGRQAAAPKLICRLGLEWLWRLMIQPTRLERILAAFPYFPFIVARSKLTKSANHP